LKDQNKINADHICLSRLIFFININPVNAVIIFHPPSENNLSTGTDIFVKRKLFQQLKINYFGSICTVSF